VAIGSEVACRGRPPPGLGANAGLTGTFFIWRIYLPDAQGVLVAAFWVGLATTAVLVAFPGQRISVVANVLVALGSVFLVVQLVRIPTPPADAVTIGVPFDDEWQVINAGRSTLTNAHWTLDVERNAIDLVQLVDGKTYRGDRSRLENFNIFGDHLTAVADGRVTAAVDGHPNLPVGGTTWHEMAGNHVILDIGGGHFVVYGHLKQAPCASGVGDEVHRGQLIGRAGDPGNTGEPHCTSRCRTCRPSTSRIAASGRSRSSSGAQRSPTPAAAIPCGRWPG
jgi:hypothetical protein